MQEKLKRNFFDNCVQDFLYPQEKVIKIESLLKKIDLREPILDLGCGTGVVLRIFKGCNIWGCDFSFNMLKFARYECRKLICADAHSLPFKDGVFSTVLCFQSFPHFDDKLQALSEMERVIKSGGQVLIIHLEDRNSLNRFHRRIREVENDFLPSLRSLKKILCRLALRVVEFRNSQEGYILRLKKYA